MNIYVDDEDEQQQHDCPMCGSSQTHELAPHSGWTFYGVTVGAMEFTVYAPMRSPEDAIIAVREWESTLIDNEGEYPFDDTDERDFDVEEHHPKAFSERDIFPSEAVIHIVNSTLL